MTLRVRVLAEIAGDPRRSGQVLDMSDDEARALVATGRAELIRMPESETPERSMRVERAVKGGIRRGRTDT